MERLHSVAKAVVDEAAESCLATDESGAVVVAPSLWPEPASLTEHLRSDGAELADVRYVEAEDAECSAEAKYVEAIAGATEWWLEHDPGVFVLGEEVGHMKGGAYQATKGLAGRYPGRVRDTPISEAGFSGVACGAAMSGLKPIVEIMFPDFALVAADQIFNQIGKLRHMYGGRVEIPLVMRTRIAVGCGYGGQHSGDPVALFALFPRWTIVAPVTPFDYVGLFNSAMRRRDPVLIVEHHKLYDTLGPVPDDFGECFVRIGSAKRLTEGSDATVLAYSSTVPLALRAAEELSSRGHGCGGDRLAHAFDARYRLRDRRRVAQEDGPDGRRRAGAGVELDRRTPGRRMPEALLRSSRRSGPVRYGRGRPLPGIERSRSRMRAGRRRRPTSRVRSRGRQGLRRPT